METKHEPDRAHPAMPAQTPEPEAGTARKKRLSMHEGIAVWADCCSCEAEPYWQEVAEEMGVDLGSDYEDDAQDAGQS